MTEMVRTRWVVPRMPCPIVGEKAGLERPVRFAMTSGKSWLEDAVQLEGHIEKAEVEILSKHW